MRRLIEKIGVILAILLVFVAPVIIIYFVFAFVLMQSNPAEWDDLAKFLFAVVSIFAVYVFCGILQNEFN